MILGGLAVDQKAASGGVSAGDIFVGDLGAKTVALFSHDE